MDETQFRTFLKHSGVKESAIKQIIALVAGYETYLKGHYRGKTLEQSTAESLESYVSWLESETAASASKPLWALRYYFDFISSQGLSDLAGELRLGRIKRKPFYLRNFRGVNPDHLARLEALYIENIDQMLDEGRTPALRQALSARTGIPLEAIFELVKLSDLARLSGVRGVRARLYHDAGLTTETIAIWEAQALHTMLSQWVEATGFDGIAPFPKEVQRLVSDARKLPLLVHY
jgi:hypothetical protein